MNHEKEKEVEQDKACLEPERGDKLFDPGPSQNILIAVCKKHYQQLAQSEQECLVPVQICVVGIFKSHPYPVAENKTNLQHHNIEHNEVDVLEPASYFFFMHNILPAAAKGISAPLHIRLPG
jgi:hypothetical protein